MGIPDVSIIMGMTPDQLVREGKADEAHTHLDQAVTPDLSTH